MTFLNAPGILIRKTAFAFYLSEEELFVLSKLEPVAWRMQNTLSMFVSS